VALNHYAGVSWHAFKNSKLAPRAIGTMGSTQAERPRIALPLGWPSSLHLSGGWLQLTASQCQRPPSKDDHERMEPPWWQITSNALGLARSFIFGSGRQAATRRLKRAARGRVTQRQFALELSAKASAAWTCCGGRARQQRISAHGDWGRPAMPRPAQAASADQRRMTKSGDREPLSRVGRQGRD
jgi:hypothetical protein